MGNIPGPLQRKKLYQAIYTGDTDRVRKLLAEGLVVKQDHFALEIAAKYNRLTACALLLERGCVPKDRRCSALDIAAVRGHREMVALLLSHDFPCRGRNPYGETLVHVAACADDGSLIDALAERGVDLDEETRGWAPIHVAVQRRKNEATYALLQNGVDVDCRNNGGHTPLEMALSVAEDDVTPVVALLYCGCHVGENLMQEQYVQVACRGNPELKALLEDWTPRSPRSLCELCMLRIRHVLGQAVLQKVKSLNLPKHLHNLVSMRDVLPHHRTPKLAKCVDITDVVMSL
jgi:ankyrin repeat protein